MAQINDLIYLFKAFIWWFDEIFFKVKGPIIFISLYSLLHDLY